MSWREVKTKPLEGHNKYSWALCPLIAMLILFYGHYWTGWFWEIVVLTWAMTIWIPPEQPYNPNNPGIRPSKVAIFSLYLFCVFLGVICGLLLRTLMNGGNL